jgi:hypothetical protein
LPVYESVHDREGCPQRQKQLLDALELMLPDQCVPILVTDAGFRRPWEKGTDSEESPQNINADQSDSLKVPA